MMMNSNMYTDLMLPGVILPEGGIDGLGEIFVGDKMSVCIKGVRYERHQTRYYL